MSKDGNQKGAQQHAEGSHGPKSREAKITELQRQDRPEEPVREAHKEGDVDVFGVPHPGKHRLDEHREQHDLAEKASELEKEREG